MFDFNTIRAVEERGFYWVLPGFTHLAALVKIRADPFALFFFVANHLDDKRYLSPFQRRREDVFFSFFVFFLLTCAHVVISAELVCR